MSSKWRRILKLILLSIITYICFKSQDPSRYDSTNATLNVSLYKNVLKVSFFQLNFQMVGDSYCHMNNKWLEYQYYVIEKIYTFGYNILDKLFTKLIPYWLRVFVVVEIFSHFIHPLFTLTNWNGWFNLIRKLPINGFNFIRDFHRGNLPLRPFPHCMTFSQYQTSFKIDLSTTKHCWPSPLIKVFRYYLLYV